MNKDGAPGKWSNCTNDHVLDILIGAMSASRAIVVYGTTGLSRPSIDTSMNFLSFNGFPLSGTGGWLCGSSLRIAFVNDDDIRTC